MNQGATKQELINSLEYALKLTNAGVISLELISRYEVEDTVVIYLDNKVEKVNIARSSGMEIIQGVCEAVEGGQYGKRNYKKIG